MSAYLRSGAQVNPYTTGRTGNDNSNGDPIDISWAVYPAGRTDTAGNDISGKPANLDAIRYVRCYTGVMQMNGIMGESSSELLGSHKATTKGTGAATKDLTVKRGNLPVAITNMGTKEITLTAGTTATYNVTSGADHVFVNGESVTCTSSTPYSFDVTLATGETQYVQIITQTGTASPFITLLKFVVK